MKDVIFGVQKPSDQVVHFSLRVLVLASVRVLMRGMSTSQCLVRRGLSTYALDATTRVLTVQYFWDFNRVA